MKADNAPAISIPVYFKSVKKWQYVLQKNKKQKTKNKRAKKRKKVSNSKSRNPDLWHVRSMLYLLHHNNSTNIEDSR